MLGPVESVDADRRRVAAPGRELPYDFLVIATGAGMSPGEITGLAEHAATIWTPQEMLALAEKLRALVARVRDGEDQTILFVVPPGNKCEGRSTRSSS